MKDFDFSGLKIVNASIANNSRYFCVGSVAEQLPEKLKRKNDQRSVVGIFKIDPKTLFTTIEMWIVDYPFKNFFVDDNMTTIMFLSRNGRELDYHFLLWDFDTDSIGADAYRDLTTIDAG